MHASQVMLRGRAAVAVALAFALVARVAPAAVADALYQPLPFAQDWSSTSAISVDDDWSGVPGIVGYFGNHGPYSISDVDPRTLVLNVSASDTVVANRSDPNSFAGAGVAEFDGIPNPVVAMQGSYKALAPYLQIHLNTLGFRAIRVSLLLRDIDGSSDNTRQQVAVQYRLGDVSRWENLEGGYVADATRGPGQAGFETPVEITLPVVCEHVPQLQLRVMTTDAFGPDEWIGVDDIVVRGDPIPAGVIGMNLGWNQCATTSATLEQRFDCADNQRRFALVGSFRNDLAIPDFVGVSATLTLVAGASPMPAWFRFGPGECREGALGMRDVGPIAGCLNPYAGAFQGGGFVVEPAAGTDRCRVRLDWARDTPTGVAATTFYTAFVLDIGSARSVDDGEAACPGCETPAYFVLERVELYSLAGGRVRAIYSPDERSFAGWQGGSSLYGGGVTPSRRSSWGAVKALYR